MRTPLLHIPTRYSCTSKPSCIYEPQTHSFAAASGLAFSELEVKESFRDSTKRPVLHPSHSLHHPPRTSVVGVVGLNLIAPSPFPSHQCDKICQALDPTQPSDRIVFALLDGIPRGSFSKFLISRFFTKPPIWVFRRLSDGFHRDILKLSRR
jgi:hypothetical protein